MLHMLVLDPEVLKSMCSYWLSLIELSLIKHSVLYVLIGRCRWMIIKDTSELKISRNCLNARLLPFLGHCRTNANVGRKLVNLASEKHY